MAGTRASSLQAQWNLLENPPVCKHFTLELEMDDTGCVLNGDYYCIICGAVIAKQEAFACQSQHIPDDEEARGYSRDEGDRDSAAVKHKTYPAQQASHRD